MGRPKKQSASKPDEITETDVEAALNVLKRDYYSDVRGVGDDLIRQVKEGEISSSEEFHDALHEAVDGTQRVIYTYQARIGLLCSDNADAYFEQGLGELDCSDGIPWETLMFAAMEEDVREYVGAFVDLERLDYHEDY